jgi:hypothetical protein
MQAMVAHAVDNWRSTMASIESEPDAGRRQQQLALMRSVKAVLEDEVRRENRRVWR